MKTRLYSLDILRSRWPCRRGLALTIACGYVAVACVIIIRRKWDAWMRRARA